MNSRFKCNYEILILFGFIALKLVICAWPFEYGYFRDELYTLAHTQHLDYGYVAIPPLLPWVLTIIRSLFGDSLLVLHLFSALSGVAVLLIAKMSVKKLGGGWLALLVALLCITLAPEFIAVESIMVYDTLSHLFWIWLLYTMVALIASDDKKYWYYFGVVAGLGLLAKVDMLFLGASIVVALLLTRERKYLGSYQFWLGGLIAFLIFLPYIIWNYQHDFITLEFFHQYATQVYKVSLWQEIRQQIAAINLFAFPVVLLGLYYFLFDQNGKKFRLLGIAFIIVLLLSAAMHTKFYLIMPYYALLLVGGALMIEKIVSQSKLLWPWVVYLALIFISGVLFIPVLRPVIPIANFSSYAAKVNHVINFFLRLENTRVEVHVKQLDEIPQSFHDRFGWEALAAEISAIYVALPASQKQKVFVYAENYGEAGALEFYRSKYPLPPVICGHQQFYLWIPKNLARGMTVIAVGPTIKDARHDCKEVKQVGATYSQYAIYHENNLPIIVCKGFKSNVTEWAEHIKNMHM